jgi:hypothetical protein
VYARDSRYRHVPQVSRLDPSGRTLLVTDLRLRAPAAGRFRHTVDSSDRLDSLAHRYYGKPRKWWRISDANPEFPSPLALLGQDVITAARLEIDPRGDDPLPPWSTLLRALRARLGVEDVRLALERRILGGAAVEVGVATVAFNQLNVTAEALVTAARAAGFPAGPPQLIRRVGKSITIPPEGIG